MVDFDDFADFIKEGDVKFIRLSFVDLMGRQKNVSVMADDFEKHLSDGVVIEGKGAGFPSEAEIRLVPDMGTVHILPWRPQHGRVARFLSSLQTVSGKSLPLDARKVLSDTVAFLKEQGFTSEIGTDSEFYLFQLDQNGDPTFVTQDKAGAYDIAPLDRGENVRREICLTMEEIGISPLSSHHEQGPGQNEITFVERTPLEACDNYVIFKSVVKAIASRNGLFASFMPKPLPNEHGNGLTINFDLRKGKKSVFADETQAAVAEAFVAGVRRRASAVQTHLIRHADNVDRMAGGKQIAHRLEDRLVGCGGKIVRGKARDMLGDRFGVDQKRAENTLFRLQVCRIGAYFFLIFFSCHSRSLRTILSGWAPRPLPSPRLLPARGSPCFSSC